MEVLHSQGGQTRKCNRRHISYGAAAKTAIRHLCPLLLSPQGFAAFCRRDGGRPRPQPQQPHGDVHLLRGLLCGLPFLLCQHLRGSHHHHLPGARGQDDGGVQPGEERGRSGGLQRGQPGPQKGTQTSSVGKGGSVLCLIFIGRRWGGGGISHEVNFSCAYALWKACRCNAESRSVECGEG